jgi:putative ABC transport system permease protein
MTVMLDAPPAPNRARDGGLPARRAIARWSWRLFVREWRQQALILVLIVLAVATTVVGSTVAQNSPPPAYAGFGSAQDLATFPGGAPHLALRIAALQRRFGPVDVIENQSLRIPGSIFTYQLRAQDPTGPYGGSMLALVSGRYPTGAHEVAMSQVLASELGLGLGEVWHQAGRARRLVGIVINPQSYLDAFALVAPGRVTSPTGVTVLFNAHGVSPKAIGKNVQSRSTSPQPVNSVSPETLSLAVLTLGMLLIALLAVGGFTVLAQRRLRSLGMLSSIGATDRRVGSTIRTNGVIVGGMGALGGTLLGIAIWLLYRPQLEQDVHHSISAFALPWTVVVAAIVLAVAATYVAASRPARSITRLSVMAALSGRPAPPKHVHRSALPGLAFLVAAFLLLGYSGSQSGHGGGAGVTIGLVLGIVSLVPALILLSPFFLVVLARFAAHAPIAMRLAVRDLARYRARSGSILAAVSISVMIAVLVATAAASRYGNVFDYAGPNLAANQLLVSGNYSPNQQSPTAKQLRSWDKTVHAMGVALGAQHVIDLVTPGANLQSSSSPPRYFNPTIYLGTPQLLHAFGIKASQVSPKADMLTMLPALAGASGLQLTWCNEVKQVTVHTPNGNVPSYDCVNSAALSNPHIQLVPQLPSGVHAPNTVLTEHAFHRYHLEDQVTLGIWMIQTPASLTSVQIRNADAAAGAGGMSVETRNEEPTSSTVIDWATTFGILLALAILTMSVGLIRSETSSDLRTLAANGAGSWTRRAITATTASALGLLGALMGCVAGYVGIIGWLRDNSVNGGLSSLGNVPVQNLLVILIGIPVAAGALGWLLAGRQPSMMARQPIE